jgi:hypothetical protein
MLVQLSIILLTARLTRPRNAAETQAAGAKP